MNTVLLEKQKATWIIPPAPELENPNLNFSRTNKGSRWNPSGNNELIAADNIRYNYNPATGNFEGRTIMGQWTNEMFDWSDFSQSSWNKENSVTVGTDIGIEGTTENIKLTPDGVSNGRIRQDKTVPDNSNEHTVQAWLKKNMSAAAKIEAVLSGGTGVTADVVVDTSDGSVVSGSATVEDDGDFWEVSFQITNNGTGNTTLSKRYYPDNTNQTSAQTFDIPSLFLNRSSPPPTPVYGETAGQSYTQDPDIATVSDLDAINFNPDEGTVIVEATIGAVDGNQHAFDITDGTLNNSINYQIGDNQFVVKESGSSGVDITGTSPSVGDTVKAAVAWDSDGGALVKDGAIVGEDTDGTVIPTVDKLSIGARGDNAFYLNGSMVKLLLYPRRLSNDNLIQETTL